MIISTKLHIPRSRTALVARPRLIRRLDEGLNRILTLVTAPAGYGKTTLLGEWAATREEPVAWVSLDAGDNDRMRFWGHTIAALKQCCPGFDEQAVLRFAAEDASGDSLMAALINGLNRIPYRLVLVWDDFHHIEEPAIRNGVVYLLNRLPSHVHLYMATRYQPPLPLSRIRVEAGLNRIEAKDLRFAPEETAEFFAACGGVQLSAEETAAVLDRTEGWIAAMRLAVLSLHEAADPAAVVWQMRGTERDISDYFFEEVLSRQPIPLQQFLLRTSILQRMTGELCRAVTGMAESASYLQRLEQESLFLLPLDERREWYRYHHLFQQFLTEQLKMREPQRWKTLHLAAGSWLEMNGYSHEAVDHYLAGMGYEHALSLLEAIAPKLMVKEWTTLCAWLSAIPDDLLLAKPMMYLTKLASQYLAGHVEAATDGYWRAIRRLQEGTSSLPSHDRETLQAGLAFMAAFRTFMDRDFEYAVQFSQEYVEKHPDGDYFIGFGSDRDGYHKVWDVYVSDGSLRWAEQVLPPLLSAWSKTRNAYFVAHLYIDYGKLQYERNRLNDAENYMRRAYDLGRSHDNVSLMTIAALWLARISAAQGNAKTAKAMLQKIAKQPALRRSPHLSGKVAWFSAMPGRGLGTERSARQWLKTSDLRSGDEIPLSMIKEYDLLACYLAELGKTEEAAALVERLLVIAAGARKQGDRIRLLVHQSRILSMQGEVVQSMDVLEEALALAQPEGYIRTFVDEGAPIGHYWIGILLCVGTNTANRPERFLYPT